MACKIRIQFKKNLQGLAVEKWEAFTFSSEHNALKYRHSLEKLLSDNSIDMEVRCYP
ncbi:MAG: hypothetical protein IJ368_09890 [Oscillospiraceae bacterium]|nr:hypothetical protein [Oscillospiraceae bacterium]